MKHTVFASCSYVASCQPAFPDDGGLSAHLGTSTPAASQACSTLEPLGTFTGLPSTVTSMRSSAGAGAAWAAIARQGTVSQEEPLREKRWRARSRCMLPTTWRANRVSLLAACRCQERDLGVGDQDASLCVSRLEVLPSVGGGKAESSNASR